MVKPRLDKGTRSNERDTIRRKIATKGFRQISEDEWPRDQMYGILAAGKQAFDRTMLDLGRMLAESGNASKLLKA